MLSPSPQLLRAIRTSLSIVPSYRCLHTSGSPISRSLSHYVQSTSLSLSTLPSTRRHNSSAIRSQRMIPRAHPHKPASHDRGPPSNEDTLTDFASLNVLRDIPSPTTGIDACLDTGFHLNSGIKVSDGDALLLVGGEAFSWRPWKAFENAENEQAAKAAMVNHKGQFELDEQVWGLLSVVWPRPGMFRSPRCFQIPSLHGDGHVAINCPRRGISLDCAKLFLTCRVDMLILGLGSSVLPLSPETKRHINSLGIRVDIQDTRNAAAQFNLLATERGVTEIAAALIPIGWSGRS